MNTHCYIGKLFHSNKEKQKEKLKEEKHQEYKRYAKVFDRVQPKLMANHEICKL
jgi:hypothetical protein